MALTSEDFELVRSLVYDDSGIVLDDKQYLVESRLSSLAQQEGAGDLSRLLKRLRESNREVKGQALRYRVVEALTTNETLFFRDVHPFAALEKVVIPELVARNAAKKQIRVWSAAASTGQEAYSIAMLLRDSIRDFDSWKVDILGTDISEKVLVHARRAIYNQLEISRGLPAGKLSKYFEESEGGFRLAPQIRRMVKFESRNLLAKWNFEAPFDLVFLRNVMIYFDIPSRKTILAKVAERMVPGSYLIMGGGESPSTISDRFEAVNFDRTTFYRLKAS